MAPFIQNLQTAPGGGQRHRAALAVLACVVVLASCGGGGGGGASAPSGVAPQSVGAATTVVAGQAIKGPVVGGKVCAYSLARPRQQIACTTTDANAAYSLILPQGSGDVLLEITGGTYVDEATGQTVPLSTPLRTLARADGTVQNLLITPFTELAVQKAIAAAVAGSSKLDLEAFQAQIQALETGLGFKGLGAGNAWTGTAADEVAHKKALEAFAKQQRGNGKSVEDAIAWLGVQLESCGARSVGATLKAYAQLPLTQRAIDGPVSVPFSGPAVLAVQPIVTNFDLEAAQITGNQTVPAQCTNTLLVDGVSENFADLTRESIPARWATASVAEITACGGSAALLRARFPLALLRVHATTGTWNFTNLRATGSAILYSDGVINLLAVVESANFLSGRATLALPEVLPGLGPSVSLAGIGLLKSGSCVLPLGVSGASAVSGLSGETVTGNTGVGAGSIIAWNTLSTGSGSGSLFIQSGSPLASLDTVLGSSPLTLTGQLASNGTAVSVNYASSQPGLPLFSITLGQPQ